MKTLLVIAALVAAAGATRSFASRPAPHVAATNPLEGPVLTYFENSRLATERFYHDGREVGEHRGWYADGTKRFLYHYANGMSEGVAQEWDAEGRLIREAHFLHGREEGLQRLWDSNGQLRANYIMRDGIRYGRFGALGCEGHVDTTAKDPK